MSADTAANTLYLFFNFSNFTRDLAAGRLRFLLNYEMNVNLQRYAVWCRRYEKTPGAAGRLRLSIENSATATVIVRAGIYDLPPVELAAFKRTDKHLGCGDVSGNVYIMYVAHPQ